MIKAVLFDVDGVLINSFEANLKFYHDLFIRAGYSPLSRDKFLTMFHMTMDKVIREHTKSNDEAEIKHIWLMGKNRDVRYPDELITSPKGYDTVIQTLSKNYVLAIVTSRVRGGVFALKQLSGLEKFFQTTVYFEDTEKHKPDPEPLLLALKQLAIPPEESVYIGDTNTDIEAAKRAGMKVIVYTKNTVSGADRITDSFDQIPKLVEELH